MQIRARVKFFIISLSRPTLILSVVLSAILMALIMNSVQSLIWWGFISTDLLIMGTIDALVIAFVLAPLVVILVSKLTSLEEEIASKEIIEKSERRYKLIAENVHDVVWVLDVETLRYLYVSPSVKKQRGYSWQETMSQSLEEVLSKESYQLATKILAEKLQLIASRGEIDDVILELKQRNKDGSENWIEVDTHLIQNKENGRLEIIGVSRDIHQRKLAQEKVRENQLRLSRAEIVAGLGNWELDLKSRMIVGSLGAQKNFGVDNGAWNEMEVNEFFLPEYRDKLNLAYRSVVRNKISHQGEYKIKNRKTGEIVDIYALTHYDAEKDSVYGIIQDITERKRIEAELKIHQEHLEKLVEQRTLEINSVNKQLREEIEREIQVEELLKESLAKEKEISELKSRFVSTTSHEFRTPLTAMLSSAQMLKRYNEKWEKEKKELHFDKIISSINNLVGMLNEIITFSKADSGKTKIKRTQINLEQTCNALIEEVSVNKKENHTFTVSYNKTEESYMLDESVLRIILINLLGNAFKYTPQGGTISLEVTGLPDAIEFKVKDQGMGISDVDQKFLFEPFFRASNSADIQGSGLGLSIVKKTLDLAGGKISVKSKEGTGTEFKVILPLSDSEVIVEQSMIGS